MQQKINAIFTKRVLELNGSLGFNDSLSPCYRAQVNNQQTMPRSLHDLQTSDTNDFIHGR